MSDETLPVTIRPAVDSDFGFILASYTRELHKTAPYNFIPNEIFFPWHTALLGRLVARSTVLMAAIDDNPDDLVGFLIARPCGEDVIVHWAHVKHIYKRQGVLKALLGSFGVGDRTIVCTHFFTLFPKMRDRFHLVFDPTILEDRYVG